MSALDLLGALARTSFAAAVLVLLVLATHRLFRKHLTPHWHCALWLLVVVRLLPFSLGSTVSIFNLLPASLAGRASVAAAIPPASATQREAGAALLAAAGVKPTGPTRVDPARGVAASTPASEAASAGEDYTAGARPWPWPTWVLCLWGLGVALLGGYVLALTLSFSRHVRHLSPVTTPDVIALWRECCARMGVRRMPAIVESDRVATPALHGFIRPRLLLPKGFPTAFSIEELRFVFLHELAHLRRGDVLLNWCMTALQIAHWFNPLVWYGFARWRVDREIACDAAALEAAGPTSSEAYGRTMLRLLENLSVPSPRPGLVGILESKHQLRQRLTMILRFQPARRPFFALSLVALLGFIGLTDAQTPAPAENLSAPGAMPVNLPQPSKPYVLFLVSRSDTMLADSSDDVALHRGDTDEQKRAAPKWQHAAEVLRSLLAGLAPGENFRVAVFDDATVETIGGRESPDDPRTAAATAVGNLRNLVPHGGADLALAFRHTVAAADPSLIERIVLITDGLSARTDGPNNEPPSPAQAMRIRAFEAATKLLPPRVPVHTILLPLASEDHAAVGLYWALANATHGGLVTSAPMSHAAPSHIAFVIDTSGSMRDPKAGGLWPVVMQKIDEVLDAHPNLAGVQILDADGRFVLGRKGTGADGWLADTPETRVQIRNTLGHYDKDTVSNPVPGTYNAIRFLFDRAVPDMHMAIYVLGDEFNTSTAADLVLRRLDELNPRGLDGRRAIAINAIGFPTTIRSKFSVGNTGLRFADLMRSITQQHDGTFVAVPDL